MKYITAKETAAKWGVSLRYVQRLLSENRVKGAKKYGRAWMIPAEAAKPADPRKSSKALQIPQSPGSMKGSCEPAAPSYLTCVLLSAVAPMPNDNPDSALNSLPDEKLKSQYMAELNYLRGNFQAVKEYFKGVTPQDATYLCAANITICAAMSTRDYPLFKEITMSVKSIEENSRSMEARKAASLVPVLAAVCMNAPEMAPDWLKNGDFSDFSADSRPMLIFMRIKYLQSIGDHSGMLASAQTARSLYMKDEGFTLVDIYFTCFCACASYALGRIEDTREYLSKSVDMCAQGGFVSPLGEYTTWVGGFLEVALKKSSPEFEAAVNNHIEATLKNWLFFHNEFARDNASLILSTKEYQLALLLKEGKTYKQAADRLCLSVGRIKNLISIIYEKLGISKKTEIGKYVY